MIKIILISFAMMMTVFMGPFVFNHISANGFDLSSLVDVLLGRVENQDQKFCF
jgi:hypothetical protein